MAKIHKVVIVVDPAFGSKLRDLSRTVHVWARSSPRNLEVIQAVWKEREDERHSLDAGITSFKVKDNDSPEEMLTGILSTVDLHHGEYSHNPPWSTIEVYGASLTRDVKAALSEFGEGTYKDIEHGFVFSRKA